MKNYKIIISYDGSKYYGWEYQSSTELTIQGKLMNVLTKLTGTKVDVIGAGRTDAGVHARGMVANFCIDTTMSTSELRDYMNQYLPEDICVLEVHEASERFHSRYNATGKTYQYTCFHSHLKPIFDRKYMYILSESPDIDLMRKAASYLIGTKDFASFCSNRKIKKSTVRTVDLIDIRQNGGYITFTYHGNGFLQHMIRILTGTLLEVGYGKRSPENMLELIDARNRSLAGFTAPANGLCLLEVDYN